MKNATLKSRKKGGRTQPAHSRGSEKTKKDRKEPSTLATIENRREKSGKRKKNMPAGSKVHYRHKTKRKKKKKKTQKQRKKKRKYKKTKQNTLHKKQRRSEPEE